MASSKKSPLAELETRLAHFLQALIQPGQRLLLGYSGGLDSTVLLHLLHRLRPTLDAELVALHINHGLSPHADRWQQHCAQTCQSLNIPFVAERVQVVRDSGLGVEAAARAARYEVFSRQAADFLLLAHHQDDQAETLLLQLLRGAGVKGLAAMPVQRDASPILLRPFLHTPRAMLEACARELSLDWVEDESNQDCDFDRNYLRHVIFPALVQRFPAARNSLARSAAHLAEADALLEEIACDDAVRWVSEGRLAVQALRELSGPRAKNLLRFWLSQYIDPLPSARRLEEIMKQVLQARAEASIEILVAGGCVRRYRDRVCFESATSTLDDRPRQWQGEPELVLPSGRLVFQQVTGRGVSREKLAGQALAIRIRAGGESLRLSPNRPARSLKNLFQEAGVPAWQRPMWPLLWCQEQLVIVPGVGVAHDWQAGADEAGIDVIWQPT